MIYDKFIWFLYELNKLKAITKDYQPIIYIHICKKIIIIKKDS